MFLSKIPYSMNKFRSFVEDENITIGLATPNPAEGIISSKEKIDIEMGTGVPEDSNFPLPDILRNLDYEYDNIETNFKHMDDEQRHGLDPFLSVDSGEKESMQSLIIGGIEPEQSFTIDSGVRETVYSSSRNGERQSIQYNICVDKSVGRETCQNIENVTKA